MAALAPARSTVLALMIGVCATALMAGAGRSAGSPVSPGATASKGGLESLSEAEIRAVQEAMIWTGDYLGVVSGTVGPRTREAVVAYLARTGASPSAPFDAVARARLIAEGRARRQAVGFAPVKDKHAGLALSLPTKLLPKQTGTDAGTRFSSADGEIVVDTLSRPAAAGALPDMFARMSATAGTRKVTYKLLRPDFFVISGEIGDHAFYSRFAIGKRDGIDAVRGFTVSYPKYTAARLDPVTLAIAASFDPFPAATKAAALPEAAKPLATPPKAPPTFADAVLVGPDVALSRISRATCPLPTVGGSPASFRAEDQGTGLALLTIPHRPGAPVSISSQALAQGNALFALFRAGAAERQEVSDPLMVAAVEVDEPSGPDRSRFTVTAPLQSRAALLFDRSGALAGLTEPGSHAAPAIAGTVLQADYRATGSEAITGMLDRAGLGRSPAPGPGAADPGLGALASGLRASIVVIACAPAAPTAP